MALQQFLHILIWACALLPARLQCLTVNIRWTRDGVETYTPESPLSIRWQDLLYFQCEDSSRVYFFREDKFSEAFRNGCIASSVVPTPDCPPQSFAGCGITHKADGQTGLAESCMHPNFLPGGSYYLANIDVTEEEATCFFALPLRVCNDETDPPECGRPISPSTTTGTLSTFINPSKLKTFTSSSSYVNPSIFPSSSPMDCCSALRIHSVTLLATILTAFISAFICVF